MSYYGGLGHNPFKRDCTRWHSMPNVYKVTHAGGEFLLTSNGRLNYSETLELLRKQGYKKPFITYIGKDVSM